MAPSESMAGDRESLVATDALAVAAHQVGDAALAARLLRGGLARDHVALRAGGEAAFWHLATGAFGALGQDAASARVTVDGREREVSLESGRAVLPIDASAGSHEVAVETAEGGAFVRVEAVAGRAFVARQGPYELRIDGDVGDRSTGAGFELSVTARRAIPEASLIEVQLPAGVVADDALRAALGGSPMVRRVEARDPAFVRLWLEPLADGAEVAIALPLRWTVRGDLRGLGVIAYPVGRPETMSVLAPRRLPIAE